VWRAAQQFQAGMSQRTLYWLLRSGFVTGTQTPAQGFILPTVTLLLLMVSLVVGMLVFRTFTRTTQVIGQRQQRVLYNAATPAIEIGKSKLEYLFTQASLPALPTDGDLTGELGAMGGLYDLPVGSGGSTEQRLDINNDGVLDNAWAYTTDADGDGTTETVAYSLLTQARGFEDLNGNGKFDDFEDLNGNGVLDWTDRNGNGKWDSGEGEKFPYEAYNTVQLESPDQLKADALVVRNGPLIATKSTNTSCPDATALSPIAGWSREANNTSKLRKSLQVHAVVLNANNVAATLEMQQDRQVDYGNKWGAWFRYDLGNWPGSTFRWNGAMHTDGSFILGNNTQHLYLVSSPSSCVFEPEASVLTMAGDPGNGNFLGQIIVGRSNNDTSGDTDVIKVHTHSGASGVNESPTLKNQVDSGSNEDSVTGEASRPSDIMLNPVALFTGGQFESIGSDVTNQTLRDANWESQSIFTSDRIYNEDTPTPFLDDTYRADNRWGPSPVYKEPGTDIGDVDTASQDGVCYYESDTNWTCDKIGDPIPSTLTDMIRNNADEAALNESKFGLDGYWERRARRYGVRIIVGQRLELGNPEEWLYEDTGNPYLSATVTDGDADGNGTPGEETDVIDANLRSNWGDGLYSVTGTGDYEYDEDRNGNGFLDIDPLYPPGYSAPADPGSDARRVTDSSMGTRDHELQQMRTLRDNLAAAQSTAVYHYQSNSGNYPVACVATTSHPGTQTTDTNSRTFEYVDTDADGTVDSLDVNFLKGHGTNGLVFNPPFAGSATTFETQVEDADSPLRIALTNLAYFAGDPNGEFPPTQQAAGGTTHPYPLLTMWGNFSELRRVIDNLNTGTDYSTLSIADQTTLHTATCTLGMLALNVENERKIAEHIDVASDVNIDDIIDDVNDALNDEVNGGSWTALVQRIEVLIDGSAGKGQVSTGNLTWDTVNPTDCPDTSYNTNSQEINSAIDEDGNGSPDKCISVENWANGLVPEYNDTKLLDPDSPDSPSDADTDKGDYGYFDAENSTYTDDNARVKAFLEDHGAAFYASFTVKDWTNASIPGDNSLADLSGILSGNIELVINASDILFDPNIDREFGFSPNPVTVPFSKSIDPNLLDFGGNAGLNDNYYIDPVPDPWDATAAYPLPTELADKYGDAIGNFRTGCNPAFLSTLPTSVASTQSRLAVLALAQALCQDLNGGDITLKLSIKTKIRYPALYYVFPLAAHYHNGAFAGLDTDAQTLAATNGIEEINQFVGDPYVTDSYISSTAVNGSTTVQFRPVEDGLTCSGGTCTYDASTRDEVVDQDGGDDDAGTAADNEVLGNFVTYLGVTPALDETSMVTYNGSLPLATSAPSPLPIRHEIYVDTNKDGTQETIWYPAIIDMALYNGRELMSVRTLSLDLNQMRQKAPGNTACNSANPTASDTADANGNCWLPRPTILEDDGGSTTAGAMIYAFREDAVREDAIARPRDADVPSLTCDSDSTVGTGDDDQWASFWQSFVKHDTTFTSGTDGTYDFQDFLMDASSTTPVDPPPSPCTGVSPKPVDFYPDPSRRPYGFLLQNGADLRRGSGSTWDTDGRGISFISDQPVYLWGDFNLHSTTGAIGGRIEEFDNTLTANWSNFYDRDGKALTADPLNENFARAEDGTEDVDTLADTWRASEIISDMVYVLSKSATANAGFTPGYVQDGITWQTGSTASSYANMTILRNKEQPSTDDAPGSEQGSFFLTSGIREDGSGTSVGTTTQPIKLSHRGFPLYLDAATSTVKEYGVADQANQKFEAISYVNTDNDRRSRTEIDTTISHYVNAIIVGAIPPARKYQPYGQLNNHIHFIENWGGNSGAVLDFKGSLIQLNFSVYSGPHDQDSWEPQNAQGTDAAIQYYTEPQRQWGFDVGLLYNPPGAVAQRLAVPSKVRSEFYREPSVDDVYIMNLRCAWIDTDGSGTLETGEKDDANRVDPNLTATECPAP